MNCAQAKALFSSYLDGAVTGTQMRAVSQHLETCLGCNESYSLLYQTQQLMARVGARKAPEDLALKLRLAISREVARSKQSSFAGLLLRLENALNAFMVPATAGLITAVAIFGVLMGSMAVPLQANNADVPLLFGTAPEVQQQLFREMDSIPQDSLVIEALVDANGRIQDYRVLSDPEGTEQKLLPQMKNMLIFTTFRPATFMGRPTSGRAVLSFSKISVRG